MNAIELTSALVQISSVSSDWEGQRAVQEACVDQLEGFTFRRSDANIPWTLATFGDPKVLFLCHTDTVPFGQGWSDDPLSGEVRDGVIHGRGSVDMKGGLAAAVITAQRARDAGIGVAILMTGDEEIGAEGAAEFAATTTLDFNPQLVIVPEATENTYSRGHRGATWFDINARGKAAHGSRPQDGVNAIRLLSDHVISVLDQMPKNNHDYLGTDTVNLGMIRGGEAPNIVPDFATMTLDFRTVAGGKQITQWLESLHDEVEVSLRFDRPPLRPRDLPAAMDPFTDVGPASYFTDGAMVQDLIDAPVIIWGPGHQDQMHTIDEVMHIDSLEQALDNYWHVVTHL